MTKSVLEASYLTTKDRDPYHFYDQLIADGGQIYWDPELKAWIVTSYEACREVMQNDDRLYDVPQ